ncbi:hypothetical protein [Nocardia xishanensis]
MIAFIIVDDLIVAIDLISTVHARPDRPVDAGGFDDPLTSTDKDGGIEASGDVFQPVSDPASSAR